MITLKAKINISDSATISSVSGYNVQGAHEYVGEFVGSNISSNISSVVGRKNTAVANPFILGATKLGSGAKYVSQVPYFTSKELSDSNGEFQTYYELKIQGQNLKNVVIVFDKQNNGHPKNILIDGYEKVVDDDAQFEIVFENPDDIQYIDIKNWNKPHSPLIITSIYTIVDLEIDKSNLISFDGGYSTVESLDYPTYGLVSHSASLTFMDYDEQALDLIQKGSLHTEQPVSISINSDTTSKMILTMKIKDLTYDNDNRQVNMSMVDGLEELQSVNVEAIPYDFDYQSARPLRELWIYLYGKTVDNGFNIVTFNDLSTETKNRLNNIYIPFYFLESDSLWNEWQKLCDVMQAHMWIDQVGKINFSVD